VAQTIDNTGCNSVIAGDSIAVWLRVCVLVYKKPHATSFLRGLSVLSRLITGPSFLQLEISIDIGL